VTSVIVGERTLTLGPITVKAARDAKMTALASSDTNAFTDALIVESLRAGGDKDPQQTFDGLSFFTEMKAVQQAALEANGLGLQKLGETQPAGPAA
jgi:hypothetical protein